MDGRHWAADDPVLVDAVRIRRPDLDVAEWSRRLTDDKLISIMLLSDGEAPSIALSAWEASVAWRRTPHGTVVYRHTSRRTRYLDLEHVRLPQTMLHAVIGRSVDEVVDVPGAGGLVVAGTTVTHTGAQRLILMRPQPSAGRDHTDIQGERAWPEARPATTARACSSTPSTTRAPASP